MRLERNYTSIVIWIFNVKLEVNISHVEFKNCLYYGRLLLLGHIKRMKNSSWPSSWQTIEVGCSEATGGSKENMDKKVTKRYL